MNFFKGKWKQEMLFIKKENGEERIQSQKKDDTT